MEEGFEIEEPADEDDFIVPVDHMIGDSFRITKYHPDVYLERAVSPEDRLDDYPSEREYIVPIRIMEKEGRLGELEELFPLDFTEPRPTYRHYRFNRS